LPHVGVLEVVVEDQVVEHGGDAGHGQGVGEVQSAGAPEEPPFRIFPVITEEIEKGGQQRRDEAEPHEEHAQVTREKVFAGIVYIHPD